MADELTGGGGGDSPRTTVTVIVPCLNEMGSVDQIVSELTGRSEELGYRIEVLFVDDGSSDQTLERIRAVGSVNPDVGFLSFSRTFGKESAMLAGLRAADGDLVVIMDGDLQHPPDLVPVLVSAQRETGADQVVARRDRTGEGWSRRISARWFYRFINRAVDVRLVDGEGDFRLLTRRACDALLELPEVNRFSKGLFAWIGFPVVVVEYQNRDRSRGESSWSLRSLVNYGVEGVASFNTKPLRTVIHLGWLAVLVSIAYVAWVLVTILREGISEPGYATIVALVVFLGGVQLISLGVVGEYVGRIYSETKRRPHYLVMEEAQPSWRDGGPQPGPRTSRGARAERYPEGAVR